MLTNVMELEGRAFESFDLMTCFCDSYFEQSYDFH